MDDASAQLAALRKCAASPACGAETLLDLASACKGAAATLMRCLAMWHRCCIRRCAPAEEVLMPGGAAGSAPELQRRRDWPL